MSELRVAFCIDNMNVGGTEMNALRTARCLKQRGIDIRVFSLTETGPLIQAYHDLDVPVHPLPIPRLYGREAWRRGREMQHLIRRHRVNVVHAHDFYSNIFAGPWARLAGSAFIASRRWWEGPDRISQRWANRAAYALADRVLANSEGVARLMVQSERVRAASITVVNNFLDDAAFDLPPIGWIDDVVRELKLPDDRLVVGVVASLQPIKDHATLLRAAALLRHQFPNLYVVLVGGDAGSRSDLVGLAAALGLADRVRFAGLRPAMPSAHHLFDVSTLTSVSEGLPNSLLEAMAAGRPVVATAVGAVSDAVEDGVTGRIVPPSDPQAVAAALAPLLRDPATRASMGAAGRRAARERYGEAAALDSLLRLYTSVLT
jgi:glycosyltransferase involved in cell wall biosynthesis